VVVSAPGALDQRQILSRHHKPTTVRAVFSRRLTFHWPDAAQRREAPTGRRKPRRLTLAVAGSTLAAAGAAAIWPAVAAADPAGAASPAHATAITATAAASSEAAATSPTAAQIAARFESAARRDAARVAAERAHQVQLLAALRAATIKAAARRRAVAAAAAAAAPGSAAAATPAQTPVATAASGSPQQIAIAMFGSFGWSTSEFSCLDPLWSRESGWNPYASNAGSGAYGIPQALPGSKMASAGADWQTNPATQIRWGLGYIQATYGSPCGAWGHEQGYGWY
jgi:hypothetical protein